MKETQTFRKYLIEEFYDDYREGEISRRTFIRRVAFLTGSMAATIAAMSAVGCRPIELPATTEPMPTDAPAATPETPPTSVPPTEPQSPFSVPADDPDVSGSDVTFPSGSDEIMGYLVRPVAEGIYPAILVCHENRGLNEHIRDVARRFAKHGYVAFALDLLSREGGTAAHDRDAVPALLTEAGADRHVGDFLAAADYLQTLDYVDGERLGMIGFCFGGGITWRVATALPTLKAAIPFYGPAPELDQVPNINAAVLGVYAEQDERINAGIEPLEAALAEAGKTYEIKIYPGVNHAFHNDTGPRYVEEQATQAWEDTLAWFADYL
ncbi:MAG: dienelactone hydrolase family protein [Caldilineaceae bacterium]|nr:dienelactone hydrolase family protein [Caldilineaceae bacterium]